MQCRRIRAHSCRKGSIIWASVRSASARRQCSRLRSKTKRSVPVRDRGFRSHRYRRSPSETTFQSDAKGLPPPKPAWPGVRPLPLSHRGPHTRQAHASRARGTERRMQPGLRAVAPIPPPEPSKRLRAPLAPVPVSIQRDDSLRRRAPSSVTLTITDDEATPTVALAVADSAIAEDGGSTTVTATLSHPSGAATTVTVEAAPEAPAVAGDYTLSAAMTVTIAAGSISSSGTVTITAVDNKVDAADKTEGDGHGGERLGRRRGDRGGADDRERRREGVGVRAGGGSGLRSLEGARSGGGELGLVHGGAGLGADRAGDGDARPLGSSGRDGEPRQPDLHDDELEHVAAGDGDGGGRRRSGRSGGAAELPCPGRRLRRGDGRTVGCGGRRHPHRGAGGDDDADREHLCRQRPAGHGGGARGSGGRGDRPAVEPE